MSARGLQIGAWHRVTLTRKNRSDAEGPGTGSGWVGWGEWRTNICPAFGEREPVIEELDRRLLGVALEPGTRSMNGAEDYTRLKGPCSWGWILYQTAGSWYLGLETVPA